MTEEKDFIEKNEEILKMTLKKISDSTKGFQESIFKSITPIVQSMERVSQSIQPILENFRHFALTQQNIASKINISTITTNLEEKED